MVRVLTDKQRRSAEAQRLLDEPLLNEAIDKIEQKAVNEILKCHFWQDRKRRMLVDRVNVVRDIKQHLKAAILDALETNKRTVA